MTPFITQAQLDAKREEIRHYEFDLLPHAGRWHNQSSQYLLTLKDQLRALEAAYSAQARND